ncbi:MAG: nucleotidyltransferase family protein [Candidatus Omnitrophota bacterium]
MKAIILAAGYATRLWPLTLNRPKPLLPLGKSSILGHIIEKVRTARGIDEILIVTNSKFVKNFNQWKISQKRGKKITVVDDGMKALDERRGSIGDIIFTIDEKNISSDVLVVAGDNIFDFKLDNFIEKSRSNSPRVTVGLFDIKKLNLANKYGIVELNSRQRIVSFKEKPKNPKSTLAAMCLYYFPKEKLPLLKKYQHDGSPLDLAGSFIKWLSQRESVYGYVFQGMWLDIGDKKSLRRAQKMKWD